ncbi:O-antigen ligase family protein [Deinococcus sp. PESE-13]
MTVSMPPRPVVPKSTIAIFNATLLADQIKCCCLSKHRLSDGLLSTKHPISILLTYCLFIAKTMGLLSYRTWPITLGYVPPSPKRQFSDVAGNIPAWASVIIGAVPLFPPLYLAGFACLRGLQTLPFFIRSVLLLFAASQFLAAALTPHPLLSLGLALARVLLILSMIGTGAVLRKPERLQPLVAGYTALFASAWVYAAIVLGPERLLHERLGHPFYYTVSLGLVATISLWLLLEFWPLWRRCWWYWPVTVLSVLTLLATQSRGAILALVAGCIGGALVGAKRYWIPIVGAGIGALLLSVSGSHTSLSRLLSDNLTGRDQVWQGAILAFQDKPWGGQGPYQAGPFYWFLSSTPCRLTDSLAEAGFNCPSWADQLNGAWLTAHNLVLHSLAETGSLGTVGLFALIVAGVHRAFQARQPFIFAAVTGYLAMSSIDVVTSGPSPHFAELFWVIIGLALVAAPRSHTESKACL